MPPFRRPDCQHDDCERVVVARDRLDVLDRVHRV
jgi:hypothetical protein